MPIEADLRRPELLVTIPTKPGEPVSVNHAYHRHRWTGKVYRTPEAQVWQEVVSWEVKRAWLDGEGPSLNTAISLTVDYYFRDNRRRDSHNFAKILTDAVASALGVDDRYIRYRDGAVAVDRDNPRVVLHIEEEALGEVGVDE